MPSRTEYLDLTVGERQAASRIVAEIGQHLPWERVEAVFRSLGRAEWLIVPHSEALQRALPMHTTSLMRNERMIATSVVLALHLALGEESAERVLGYLAQRGAALDALLIHEAAAPFINRNNESGRAVL